MILILFYIFILPADVCVYSIFILKPYIMFLLYISSLLSRLLDSARLGIDNFFFLVILSVIFNIFFYSFSCNIVFGNMINYYDKCKLGTGTINFVFDSEQEWCLAEVSIISIDL